MQFIVNCDSARCYKQLLRNSSNKQLLHKVFSFFSNETETDIILTPEEGVVSPAEDDTSGPLCFFDVLADYYVLVPESGKPILDLIVQLWSQSFASHIFTLLFHKWVCWLAYNYCLDRIVFCYAINFDLV